MVEDYQYAPLDFSSIMGEKFAVHCQTEEDAKHFCHEVKRQFGKTFWSESEVKISTNWNMHKEQTAYTAKLNDNDLPMTYCYIDWYVAKGYLIVPFDDLRVSSELDEFELDGIDLNTLFG